MCGSRSAFLHCATSLRILNELTSIISIIYCLVSKYHSFGETEPDPTGMNNIYFSFNPLSKLLKLFIPYDIHEKNIEKKENQKKCNTRKTR